LNEVARHKRQFITQQQFLPQRHRVHRENLCIVNYACGVVKKIITLRLCGENVFDVVIEQSLLAALSLVNMD